MEYICLLVTHGHHGGSATPPIFWNWKALYIEYIYLNIFAGYRLVRRASLYPGDRGWRCSRVHCDSGNLASSYFEKFVRSHVQLFGSVLCPKYGIWAFAEENPSVLKKIILNVDDTTPADKSVNKILEKLNMQIAKNWWPNYCSRHLPFFVQFFWLKLSSHL